MFRKEYIRIESSTQHYPVNDFVVLNIPNKDVEPKQIILDPDDQLMWESAKTVAPTLNSAIIQLDVDDNFVINSTQLNMIQKSKFDGYLRADPHDHIREFLAICDMFKYGETQSKAVKLLIFPFSLCDKAKIWFNELNEESITSWEQMRRAFITNSFHLRYLIIFYLKSEISLNSAQCLIEDEDFVKRLRKHTEFKIQEMVNIFVSGEVVKIQVAYLHKTPIGLLQKGEEDYIDMICNLLNVKAWKFRFKGKIVSFMEDQDIGPFEILERIGLVAYRLRLPEELNSVHDTFHVSNQKKCLADANLHVPLDEIKVDKTLRFVEEHVEIMDREIKRLKHRKVALVKVRWNSKCGPEFTWEHENQMRIKYP
ncbi:hypothetical protein Tco_1285710 [Tanacetum coccineum]